jgi:hypothetical protein
MYYTKGKFNYKVAFIFLANQIYGPDIVFLFIETPFHSILGFAIYAIPLAFVFSYASRFSLIKSEGKFPLKFEDGGTSEINWRNAYLLIMAGTLSHFFIDQFFHFEQTMSIWSMPTISITYDQMLSWGGAPYHVFSPLMVIGEAIVIIMILLSIYYFRKGSKDTFKAFLTASLFTLVVMILGGVEIGGLTAINGGERELAVLCVCTIYILIPLFLLMYVARDVQDNPIEELDKPKFERERLLKIVPVIGIIVGVFLVLYGVIAVTLASDLTTLIKGALGNPPEFSENDTIIGLTFLGFYYGIIALLLIIGSIGVLFRNNICRYIAIASSLYFFMLGFPLAIALFLCEKDVKAQFLKKSRE